VESYVKASRGCNARAALSNAGPSADHSRTPPLAFNPLTRAAHVPLVAIGGIDISRVSEVARFAGWICVIGALVPPSERLEHVTAHVKEFIAAIDS